MSFKTFAAAITKNMLAMTNSLTFRVTLPGDLLWQHYLKSFPAGTNEIFRTKPIHEGSYDKNFVRQVGGLINIRPDGKIVTIWDGIKDSDSFYNEVAQAMSDFVRSNAQDIDLFKTNEGVFGHKPNVEKETNIHFTHFFIEVPGIWRLNSSPAECIGEYRTRVATAKRCLEEITMEAVDTVIGLVNDNLLYRGMEFYRAVTDFKKNLTEYNKMTPAEKFYLLWNNPINNIRKTAIGTLLVNLSDGVPLEDAVRMYESTVAPANYKRPKALITPKMVKEAEKAIADAGIEGAFYRRFAKLSDVAITDVLWASSNAAGVMKGGISGLLSSTIVQTAPNNKDATKIGIEEFLKSVAPNAKNIEAFVGNSLTPNFMAITAPEADAKGIFKWDNNFAWSYNGGVTDSIAQKVAKFGGKVTGALRVSLAWFNGDDLDLHCKIKPFGSNIYGRHQEIYYNSKQGILDLDMNGLDKHSDSEPVENMIWPRMPADGDYSFHVNMYSKRIQERNGFEIEVAFNNEIFKFSHPHDFRNMVHCFTIRVSKGVATLVESNKSLTSASASKEEWGVKTETFVPVDTIMLSPNHWGTNKEGNKHFFFLLKGCISTKPVRGFYNEFLKENLGVNKRVTEVLGSKTMCQPTPSQLCGLGFSSTQRNQMTVKVDGRPYTIIF